MRKEYTIFVKDNICFYIATDRQDCLKRIKELEKKDYIIDEIVVKTYMSKKEFLGDKK